MEILSDVLIVLSVSTICLLPLWATSLLAFVVADATKAEAPTWLKSAVRVRQ